MFNQSVTFKYLVTVLVTLWISHPSLAYDLEKGLREAQEGNFAAALNELEPLASQGIVEAQISSALIYMQFFDFAKAEKLFREADKRNHPDASFYIGLIYQRGLNGVHDPAEAVKWFIRSASFDNPDAHYMLHIAYDQGIGEIEKDPEAAFMHANAAASLGHTDAQYKLALFHATGEVVEQNLALAHMWFEIAAFADTFDQESQLQRTELSLTTAEGIIEILDLIAKQLTLREVLKARLQARICVASNYTDCEL